jgi:predicted benzoate:H+ symporter BenE
MIGGALAAVGILQVSGLALLGALAASVAAASDRPRRVASWIPPAIIVVAIATVSIADLIGVGTHHAGA